MSLTNSEPTPPSDSPSPHDFNGHGEMGLAEIMQLSCLARRSGQMTFRSGPSYGFVFIQQGQVLHAMCGTVEGEEAVYLMLSWPAGGYTIDEDILPHKRTIQLTWEQLLFEGARRADIGGLSGAPQVPVITANPLTTTRAKDSLPKLIISRGDEPPATVELQGEYSRLGRAEDNELYIPDPSVSNRHCIFILSGADVVLRDLNSSNGTYVNGENISETILRPGDSVQVGVIDIKFVPGVRRPKLTQATSELPKPAESKILPRPAANLRRTTVRLPFRGDKPEADAESVPPTNNREFVSGRSPISYDQLAPGGVPKTKSSWGTVIVAVVVLLVLMAGAVVYLLFVRH